MNPQHFGALSGQGLCHAALGQLRRGGPLLPPRARRCIRASSMVRQHLARAEGTLARANGHALGVAPAEPGSSVMDRGVGRHSSTWTASSSTTRAFTARHGGDCPARRVSPSPIPSSGDRRSAVPSRKPSRGSSAGRCPPWRRSAWPQRKTALYHELADGHAPPVPGVVEFVRGLAAADVPRALATSAVAESAADPRRARTRRGVPRPGDRRQVRRGKPDPEVYLTAAARLGVPPAVCVVFEDAVVGVEAARRAGMAVVGLTTAHAADELREAGATWTAPDFTGLAWAALTSP